MAILDLFLELVSTLRESPEKVVTDDLDSFFKQSSAFSYIGNRKGLDKLVLDWMKRVRENVVELSVEEQARFHAHPELVRIARRLRPQAAAWTDNPNELIKILFGKDWQKNSGAYPDFILAWDRAPQVGNGAILELKDSRGLQIASFNSTIPTRFKSLRSVQRETKSKMPLRSASLYDLPLSLEPGYLDSERNCFYLIRTNSKDSAHVRLSLVDGSFFETVPKAELLAAVWSQILEKAGLTEEQRSELAKPLAQLEQGDIARSRSIDKASVKPRFRIMAEAHADGNPHLYPEIYPRTCNLIIKLPDLHGDRWVKSLFSASGLQSLRMRQAAGDLFVRFEHRGQPIKLKVFSIRHKRNGDHLVLQYPLLSGFELNKGP